MKIYNVIIIFCITCLSINACAKPKVIVYEENSLDKLFLDYGIKERLTEKSNINYDSLKTSFQNDVSKISNKASCQIKSLFSSEKESWPFETFVINGLFPIVVSYQKTHPKAVFIENGILNLEELLSCIQDSEVFEKKQGIYTLSYPLIIEEGAVLLIENAQLEFSLNTGASIINKGLLQVVSSTVKGFSDPKATFNGFITNWAKASLYTENSEFLDLGFKGHLTGGISFSKSKHQNESDKNAVGIFNKVIFNNCYQSIWGDHANLVMINTGVKRTKEESISIKNSRIYFKGNKIQESLNGDGIRLSENIDGFLLDNDISSNKDNGIKIDNQRGNLKIINNHIHKNLNNGLSLKSEIKADEHGKILVHNNLVELNGYSGIFLNGISNVLLWSNIFKENKSYGLVSQGISRKEDTHYVIIVDNAFKFNLSAQIKYENVSNLLIGPNEFYAKAIDQRIFNGDLKNIQSIVLPKLIKEKSLLVFEE